MKRTYVREKHRRPASEFAWLKQYAQGDPERPEPDEYLYADAAPVPNIDLLGFVTVQWPGVTWRTKSRRYGM
jgi:hypothetical protein